MKYPELIIALICIILLVLVGRQLLIFSVTAPKENKPVYHAAYLSHRMMETDMENVLFIDGIDSRIRKVKRIVVDVDDDFENLVLIDRIQAMRVRNLSIYSVCHNRGMSRLYLQSGVILLQTNKEITEVLSHAGEE